MNKTKIILAAIGGVILVAVLGAAAFAYLAYAAKTVATQGDEDEGTDGLETAIEKAESISRKSVFPCAESVKTLSDSRASVLTWKDAAFGLASRGDRPIAKTTDAQFKADIVRDAKALADLPADSTNKVVAADFDFGPFRPYIAEGAMPEEAELAQLQRKWDDVRTLIEMLSMCGVQRVEKLEVKAEKAAKPVEDRPKKRGARRSAAKEETVAFKPASHTYVFACKTQPAALVKALNALTTSERFIVVDDFSFAPVRDAVAAALGGEAKAEEVPVSGRRRRRMARAESEEPKAAEPELPKVTVVTDPTKDALMDAVLMITVHDFKSREGGKEETKEEEETK